jgi:hypothetical protein
MTASTSTPETLSSCLDACQRCHHTCLEHSIQLFKAASDVRDLQLLTALTTCIGMTRITAEIILIEAVGQGEACERCAAACRACVELCTAADMDDCRKACLDCADCCDAAREKLAA